MMRIKFDGKELSDDLILIGEDGIGSCEGDISVTDYATLSGGIISRRRIPSREITLSWQIVGCTPEEARIEAHDIFPMLKQGTLEIITPLKDVTIDAYVKRIECNLWSQAQRLDVTFTCPEPYFYSTTSKSFTSNSNHQWLVKNDGEDVGCICEVSRSGYVRLAGSSGRLYWDASDEVSADTVLTLDMREGHRDLYYLDADNNRISLLDCITEWDWFLIPHGNSSVRSYAVNGALTITERWLAL